MKKIICLLFVLALIAQIAAIPADKDKAEATAAVEKAAPEAKKNDGDPNPEVGHKADDAHPAAADDKEKLKKDEPKKSVPTHPHPHSKGFQKPSDMVETVEKIGKRFADEGTKIATGFLKLFGL